MSAWPPKQLWPRNERMQLTRNDWFCFSGRVVRLAMEMMHRSALEASRGFPVYDGPPLVAALRRFSSNSSRASCVLSL